MIFFVGPHNVGKTTFARYLTEQHPPFLHVETGDIIRRAHQSDAPHLSIQDWAKIHANHFDHLIEQEVRIANLSVRESCGQVQDVIVTGNRQPEGVLRLINAIEPASGLNTIIYLDASIPTLYERQLARPERHFPGMNLETFASQYLGFDLQMGLERLRDMADFIISTDAGPESFHQAIEALQSRGYMLPRDGIEGFVRGGRERML